MDNVSEFVGSLINTKSLLESQYLWPMAMADALLVDAIQEAVKAGHDPKEYVNHTIMLVQERAMEWLKG